MSKFKKGGKKETPGISTASLPDIVFMLLFFFMVTTVMRETTLKVQVSMPKATEVAKLQRKSLINYIYIGEPIGPLQSIMGTEERVQLDDAFARPSDIQPWVEKIKSETSPAEVPLLTYAFKVDRDAKMGIVTDVKQELREAQALKISYITIKEDAMDF